MSQRKPPAKEHRRQAQPPLTAALCAVAYAGHDCPQPARWRRKLPQRHGVTPTATARSGPAARARSSGTSSLIVQPRASDETFHLHFLASIDDQSEKAATVQSGRGGARNYWELRKSFRARVAVCNGWRHFVAVPIPKAPVPCAAHRPAENKLVSSRRVKLPQIGRSADQDFGSLLAKKSARGPS